MFEANAQTRHLAEAVHCGETLQTRRNNVLGQILFCQGCCCGQTDKGFPELPRDEIKALWKQRKLNATLQLTISGCLGPCDLANVFCLLTPDQAPQWFGGLRTENDYTLLLEWVVACHEQSRMLPMPPSIERRRFVRFAGSQSGGCCDSAATPDSVELAIGQGSDP
jgi:hypothetical protein